MYRVAFIQHGFGFGGATKSLLLMQKGLRGLIYSYTYTLPFKKDKVEILNLFKAVNADVKAIDIPSVYSYSAGTMPYADFEKNINTYPTALIKEINKNNIDIVHVNTSVFSPILKHIKQDTKAKVIVHIREMLPNGIGNKIDNYIIDNTLEYADKIIAISPEESKYFNSPKTVIIPNPHDFEATKDFIRSTPNEKLIVGMVSGFLPYKGHLTFIAAAEILVKKYKLTNIEFRIIGYPKSPKSLKALIKFLFNIGYKSTFDKALKNSGIQSYFRIIPHTMDVYPHLSQFDIYIRPDDTGQPWGRDIIEAMALKLPVIATGSMDYFVKNNETGFLVVQKNPAALAEKIAFLAKNDGIRDLVATNAYNLAWERCNMENYGKKILNTYSSLF